MKKTLLSGIVIFCLYLFQTTLFAMFSIGGIRPNLLIIATASLGFLGGKRTGIYAGFFSGLLIDIAFRPVYGINALMYMYIGYICGLFKKVIYSGDIKMPLLFIAGSDFVYNIAFYFVCFFFRGKFEIAYYFVNIILPEVVYTTIIACIIYPCIQFLMKQIDRPDKKGEQTIV